MRNVNLPKTKVFIRCDTFGGPVDEYEAAWLVSVRAMRNRPLCFQVWVEKYAACFDKVPPQCVYWYEPEDDHTALPLHKVQMWECLSGSIEVTIDYLPEGQASGTLDVGDTELLEEHKEGNVLKLANGQIAIYPNNRIKWLPVSLTGKEAAAAIPDWSVATNAQWDEWWSDSDEILGDAKWAY
jgi:hypothetical protein